MLDLYIVTLAFGAHPGDPNWNTETNPQGPDINGDGIVNGVDQYLVALDFGKTKVTREGTYSWFTSGGGDYFIGQALGYDETRILSGETITFSFYFYPETVAPDGSLNNAEGQIFYVYGNNQNATKRGAWIRPTSLGWWMGRVTETLPSTTYYVEVIIHGVPNFRAWIDSAQVATSGYTIYYRLPPYSNQATDPTDGTCVQWMNAMVCADANYRTGQAYAYAWDQSGAGVGKLAYGQFNRDPPTGNSPTVSLGEGQSFKVGAYWVAYGGFGEAYSSVAITVYLYYLRIGVGWEVAGSYEFKITSWQYPSQAIYYEGTVSVAIPSPPKGAGGYSVAAKAWTYAGGDGGSAVADFLFYPYFMYIDLLKITD
jgi:hypothetical protein